MNAVDMNQVIEKLAEKAGVAVEALRPVAEEVVRQYQVRASIYAAGCFLGAVAAAVVGVWCLRRLAASEAKGWEDGSPGYMFGLGFGASGTAILLIFTVEKIGHAIAPLVSLLGL